MVDLDLDLKRAHLYGGRHDHRDHGGVRTDPLGLRAPQGAPDRRWDAHGPPEDARRVAQTLP